MNPYEPLERFDDELDPELSKKLLKIVFQYFSAARRSDFSALLTDIDQSFDPADRPIDPAEYIIRRIVEESERRLSILTAVEAWLTTRHKSAPIDIEPYGWLVQLQEIDHIGIDNNLKTSWVFDPDNDDDLVLKISNMDETIVESFKVGQNFGQTLIKSKWSGLS